MNIKTCLRLLILILFIPGAVCCSTSRKTADSKPYIVQLSDTVSITDGSIIYALPRTVFSIRVEMERRVEIPGPYARYASDLLGVTDAVVRDGELWSVTGITVKAHEELDPSEYYVVKSNSFLKSNLLSLRKEGLILDINPRQFYSSDIQFPGNGTEFDQLRFADLGSDEYYNLQRDTAYKRVSIDSTFIRLPYIVEKKRSLTKDQLAEKAAKRIMELREGKHLILTGEANVFPQSDAAINEINRMEREYMELFTGKIIKEKRSYFVNFIPEPAMEKKAVPIFRFSELTGPVAASGQGGIAITAEISPEQKTKALTVINKSYTDQASSGRDKMFYRVPDIVNLKISMGKEVLFNSRKLVYQFGETIPLPSNFIIGK